MGENIRRHRHALGLTQEQLGEKLGVSYQAISRWENGTAYPDIEFLQRFCCSWIRFRAKCAKY